jgi:hypothetical protein
MEEENNKWQPVSESVPFSETKDYKNWEQDEKKKGSERFKYFLGNSVLIVFFLICFWPLGVVLMWLFGRWETMTKAWVTIAIVPYGLVTLNFLR